MAWRKRLPFSVTAFNLWPAVGGLTAVALGLLVAWLPLSVSLEWLLKTAVILLTLIQPLAGLAVALLVGPWGALEAVWGRAGLLDSGQLFLLLTLAIWLARGAMRRRIVLPRTALDLPLAIFVGVTAVTVLRAPSIPIGFKELLKWLEIWLILWLVLDLLPPTRYRWLVGIVLLAGLSQAFIGIWQFGLRGSGPETFMILGRFYRAYGTFEQPNPFAGFMNWTAWLAMGTAVGLIVHAWQKRSWPHTLTEWGWWGFVALCAGASVIALVMSWSRGAWLGFVAGGAVFVLFWPRQRWQGGALLVTGGALIGLLLAIGIAFNRVPASIVERITSSGEDFTFGDVRGVDINDANYAVLERLAHWQAALDMARDHLWLGVGFGNYEPAYPQYELINWPYPLGHAHNYYLNLLAETGVLGLAAYVVLWTAVILQAIRLLNQLEGERRGIMLGLLAVWAALAVHQLVDKLYVNNLYLHLGALLALQQLFVFPSEVLE